MFLPQKTILVVDDDPVHLELLYEIFSQRPNIRVETSKNAFDALGKIVVGEYDLVILDIVLPDMNGLQIIRYINKFEHLKNTHFVLMSSHMEQYKNTILPMSVIAKFEKPFRFDSFIETINKFIERKAKDDMIVRQYEIIERTRQVAVY